jgi:hypothetical protein
MPHTGHMSQYISEYDDQGFELPMPAAACRDFPTGCAGEVFTRYSRSGMTSTFRCDAHESAHQDVLDGISRRYPDSDVAPDWFDPTYAGEQWNDDY